jgi:thymidylate synthase
MRRLGREEDLEDTISYLSIYLNGLDHLYCEQAEQLKHQIKRVERAEQRIELEGINTRVAEVSPDNLQ